MSTQHALTRPIACIQIGMIDTLPATGASDATPLIFQGLVSDPEKLMKGPEWLYACSGINSHE